MSNVVELTNVDMKPSFATKPDMRFATTFLSVANRDYAIKGEAITDKATGEMFIKRPADGRVVSFYQNKKYMYNLMLELKVLLNNNSGFTYPKESDFSAFYLSTDYDFMSINDEKDKNLMIKPTGSTGTSDIIINNHDKASIHQLRFPVSMKSNGFFIRLTSRDSDKVLISWFTAKYNELYSKYKGPSDEIIFTSEAHKFEDREGWWNADAVIKYTVRLRNPKTKEFDENQFTANVRVNEQTCVMFSSQTIDKMDDYDFCEVTIDEIYYEKMRHMIDNKAIIKSKLGVDIDAAIEKFGYPDRNIFVRYCNICHFVDNSSDVKLLNNEFLIAMLDMPYVVAYMNKMAALTQGTAVIYSVNRPENAQWSVNSIWAEPIRHVFKGGYELHLGAETDFYALEEYFADNSDLNYLVMNENINETNNIYVDKNYPLPK